tara:strand:+ start:1654 stop:1878 length:225 start_codon:yes stop_codon:yes gene_type:complete
MATKTVINCATGEQTIVELTAEEVALIEQGQAEAEAERKLEEAAAAQAAVNKAAGQDKLKALGLTDEEIAALVG